MCMVQFPGGAIMNDVVMKHLAGVSCTQAVYFCGYMHRSGISGSDDMQCVQLQ